jgi:hypothetical protein
MRLGALAVTSLAASLAMSSIGCEKPPVAAEQAAPVEPPPPPPPECRPAPLGDVVAQWVGPDRCPIAVVASAATLTLESLALAPRPAASGAAPTCRVAACRYEGVNTELGPMLVVTEPGAESEVPTAAFLGVVTGTQLVFVDLWAGAGGSVSEDATAVGPAHALTPMQCGAELGLFARPRVSGMENLPVPPTLVARQGRMSLRGDATIRPGVANGCRSLTVPLP